MARGDGPGAVEVFSRLVRKAPNNAEYHRLLAGAWHLAGDADKALHHAESATSLMPATPDAWLDHADLLAGLNRFDEAFVVIDRGLVATSGADPLLISKARLLRQAGREQDAVTYLTAFLKDCPDTAWAHHAVGQTLADYDRDAANRHFREAVRLAPTSKEYLATLADSLYRTRTGHEGANVQAALVWAQRRLALGGPLDDGLLLLRGLLQRCGEHEAATLGVSFDTLGREAAHRLPNALHGLVGQVRTPEDRRRLVEHHRHWGSTVEMFAARTPLVRRPTPPRGHRIRIGFMSSDLRHHPVSYFVLPLLQGYDRERFEVSCYSWSPQKPDPVQAHIAGIVDRFRHAPGLSDRDAAQLIADDHLDILFELGGFTYMNKLKVMAWKPAPVQVSWLGYPHSAGLAAIDHILVDPFIRPNDPALLIEEPFQLERSWVVLGELGFNDKVPILPGTPEERAGRITFGTMNNPMKYSPDMLAAWAEVVLAVPGSRFLFVRPEGGTPAFCENMWRAFEASGVARDRVDFLPVRGTHLQHYNAVDIALDTFPQTGGTTTCESLWMGVPVVTLVGEAFFERLSYSNLSNAGLPDLCTFDRAQYVQLAVGLAEDRERRAELRRTLRDRIRSHPLGRRDLFVSDFQTAVEHTLGESRRAEGRKSEVCA
jgi:hypothetical protein